MRKKRPKGVTVLGVGLMVCVIPGAIAAVIGGISSPLPNNTLDIPMRVLFISSPIAFLFIAIRILKLKNWRRLTIYFLSPLLSFITVGSGSIFIGAFLPMLNLSFIVIPGTIIMSIAIAYYLTRPKVKEMFR